MIRHKEGWTGTNPTAEVRATYADTTFDIFSLATNSQYFIDPPFTLTPGKTLSTISVSMKSTGGLSGTFTETFDFVQVFKETLTLPTAIRPLQERKLRNIVEIPILAKEGGVQQDLGSLSPEYTIAGSLYGTTSGQSGWTNTYTADQWWQILKGVQIETGTIQADGNSTWQWLTSDNLNGKVFLKGLSIQQVPGRMLPSIYHDYVLSLKQFDVIGESTANLPGITY